MGHTNGMANGEANRCDLFVGRLAESATVDNVRTLFDSIGLQIHDPKVPLDYQGQPKGYAFVSLVDPSKTLYAIEQLNGQTFNGRTINVEQSTPNGPGKGDGKGKGEQS